MHVACRAGPPPVPHVSAPGPALPPPLLPWHGGQTGPSTDSSSAQCPPTPGPALLWQRPLYTGPGACTSPTKS